MRWLAVLMCAAIVAACGGAASERTSSMSSTTAVPATSDTTTIPTTTVTTPTFTAPPNTAAPAATATPPPSFPPETIFVPPPPPEPTTPATTPAMFPWTDEMSFGRPALHLLDALPAEDIPWEVVGPDWLALDFPRLSYTNPPTLDQRGLYLVDPDNRIYAVSALPSDPTDVMSVSWTGRIALLRGPYPSGLPIGVLDLETTDYRQVLPETRELEQVTFTTDGDGLWIYDIIPASQFEYLETVRVSRIDLATRTSATTFEESVDTDMGGEYYNWWVNSRGGLAEMPNGEIVTATPTGVWVGDLDGHAFRRLNTPEAACSVAGAWSETDVLIRCELPGEADGDCDPSGLWLAPIDGRPSVVLALPENTSTSYGSAVPFDGGLAISAGFGAGECNSGIVLIGSNGVEVWVPPIAAVDCNESIIGIRNGAVLIVARNPYVMADPRAVFELLPTGTTVVDIPDGSVRQLVP